MDYYRWVEYTFKRVNMVIYLLNIVECWVWFFIILFIFYKVLKKIFNLWKNMFFKNSYIKFLFHELL